MVEQKWIDAYLERINYQGALRPDLETLQALQRAHLYQVPFENLDIHHGVPISLDLDRIYRKVIEGRRGGFCYELNGLFHELLKALGFEVQRMSARVYSKEKGYGAEFDHLFNWVTIAGRDYLSDVGFGEFSLEPLAFLPNQTQEDPRGIFIIEQHDPQYWRVSKESPTGWVPEHIFQIRSHPYEAYAAMCAYHQSSPDSHFTQKRLISLATPTGRVSITGQRIKIRRGEQVEELPLTDETAFTQALWQYFQVRL